MKPNNHTGTAILVTAFAWSGATFGMNCACDAASGACAECCGAQDSGFKHCGSNSGDPTPPAVFSVPKSMPAAELPPPVPVGHPAPQESSDEAGTKPIYKSPMPNQTQDNKK